MTHKWSRVYQDFELYGPGLLSALLQVVHNCRCQQFNTAANLADQIFEERPDLFEEAEE